MTSDNMTAPEAWTALILNPQGLKAVYGERLPPLTAVRLRQLTLHEDGPALTLRLDLSTFPADPPLKWAAKGFNTVQITLSFSGLRTLTLHGFGTEITADLVLEAAGTGVTVHLAAPGITVAATAEIAYLAALSAYTDGGSP